MPRIIRQRAFFGAGLALPVGAFIFRASDAQDHPARRPRFRLTLAHDNRLARIRAPGLGSRGKGLPIPSQGAGA